MRVFTKEWKSRLKRNRLTEQLTKRQRTTERGEQPGAARFSHYLAALPRSQGRRADGQGRRKEEPAPAVLGEEREP